MTDESDEHQPALTLSHKSFVRGELEGRPCVVVYDSAIDKTDVIAFKSKGYPEALIALATLEMVATPLPKSARDPKTVIHMPKKPRLILRGTDASH